MNKDPAALLYLALSIFLKATILLPIPFLVVLNSSEPTRCISLTPPHYPAPAAAYTT